MLPSIPELASALRSGEDSTEALLDRCLARIQAARSWNAVLSVDESGARSAAAESDRLLLAGKPRSLLEGIPVLVKDNICVQGWELTCGSRLLEGFRAPYDATAVTRLRAAGAVLLGRTNCDEFGMGSSGEHSAYGPIRNPAAPDRVPGGSSGGSAAAVRGGLAPAALGTDTGGSVRQPAAFCGVVGLKPTYGRISRHGLVAFASSLDCIGPLAPDCRSAGILMECLAGEDPRDSTSLAAPPPTALSAGEAGAAGIVIGVPRALLEEDCEPEIRDRTQDALERLREAGARLVEVELPHHRHAVATYYLIANAEASANLARYDGVRYGQRRSGEAALEEMYRQTRSQGFGPEVKRRIMLGTYALSAGYYDAFYRRAQQVRTLIRRELDQALRSCHVLVHPTSPIPPFRFGEKLEDPLAMYRADRFTVPASLAGLPGLSVPIRGAHGDLPAGLHFTARPLEEETALRLGAVVEERSP